MASNPRNEVETALRILGAPIDQDWDRFEGSSKKLGSNATRALNMIRERIAAAKLCLEDALKDMPHAD